MKHEFVDLLPDLIQPNEYSADPEGGRIRLRIRITSTGVEILGDAASVKPLETLLEQLGAISMQQMLCG